MTKNRNTEELKALKNDIDSLMAVMDCGILDLPHADQYLDMVFKKKEHYVLMVHNTKIQKQKGVRKNGKEYVIFAARPNGEKNYIKCAAYEGLIEKLYMYYTDCLADRSLKTLYSEAKGWKASNNIEISTLRRYQTTWEKFIEPYEISGKDIRKITAEDWTEHYETIIRKFSLTKKQVNNIRDVVSMITAYAQKKKIISHNTAKDVLYEDLPYKQTAAYNSVKVKPFTEDAARRITEWCFSELSSRRRKKQYLLAIVINMILGLRFAELYALKWQNIDFREKMIAVKSQAVYDYELDEDLRFVNHGRKITDHIKGYEEERYLPLPDDLAQVFMQIKTLGLSDEYVFPHFRYNTYNNIIKEAAEAIGLDRNDYRTHSLRATAATLLYQRTHDIYQVQSLLGHTNSLMTMKYIKNLLKTETLKKTMLSDSWSGLADHCGPLRTKRKA